MPFLPPNQQHQSTEGKQSAIALANISSLQVVLYVQTRELPRERDNARNNARCTQARKTTHGLDGQHQDMDRTPCGRVSQNDRGQRKMDKVHPWCGQPSDRGWLKNTTEQNKHVGKS